MELKYIERIIKELDELLEKIVENQEIQNTNLDQFLDKCFNIIKSCTTIKKIYFSSNYPEKNEDRLVFPIGIKDEIIGYIVIEDNTSQELSSIIIQNLKYIIFIFLSFKELYNSIDSLKYMGVKFEAYRRAFYDISKAMLTSLSEETLLNIICRITQDLVLCSACIIFFRNKVYYTASNKLIEQELNFIIPELKNTIEKRFELFYSEGEIIEIQNVFLKHLKSAFVKRFSIPTIGTGTFILLFTKEADLSNIDMDFVSTVTSNIATALETRNLFEQLAIKNTFLEKLFIGSTRLSQVNSFEELYHTLFLIVNDMFSDCDFVVFSKTKGYVFKPSYIKISNSKILSFVEASEISLTVISEELSRRFALYKSLVIFKEDDSKNDLVRFFDLIFQRPYVIVPIVDNNNVNSLIVFNVKYQFWFGYQTVLDILSNHLSVLFSYVFSRVNAYEKLLAKSNETKIINRVIFDYSSIRDINVLISNFVKEINNLISYSIPVFCYYKGGNVILVKTVEHYKSLVLTVVNNLPTLILNKVKESIQMIGKGKFKPVLINNLELFFDNINVYDFVRRSNLKSLLILPIKNEVSDSQPFLLVFSLSNRFEENYLELLYSLASNFSIFFENASIYSFLEERLKATDILYNFLRIVTSVLDPYNVVIRATEFLEELIKPDIFLFALKKYHNFEFIHMKPKGINLDYNSILKALAYIGTNVVLINRKNILTDKNFKRIWTEINKNRQTQVKQIFVIPIVYLREVLGYIILGIAKENINEALVWILTNIPYALSTPLKNSMIMQEQVEISNIIRQALTTRIDKKSFHKKGIDLNYKHVASREITADWLEIIEKKDSLTVILADVSGKGAKSAIYTAQAKFAAKSLFYTLDDFEFAVNELNKILSLTVSDDNFITMLAVNIYRKNNKVYCQYLTAGHEPLIIIKNPGKIDILSTQDVPLCINQEYIYKPRLCELKPGDILFLYTDGAVDIKNENSESFGRNRLFDLIKNLSSSTQCVKELTDRVYIEVMKFSSTPLSNPPDDITLVFIKIL
ncbi:MAG: PP2C family protein-serine/threonine phosphatase [Candidatus Calescibacterium sp.]|nr:serine/threonine-protein phosphatase [Candidatus Calescibacterium sp.]MDW8195640.1 PP2C family protein-serine/threonine phosphatase [Candidatus Calescibacterium sp.]